MNWTLFFLILGGLVIVILSFVAIRLVYKVNCMKRERDIKLKAIEQANEKAQREQREWMNKSIQILAQALQNEELTLTEASIRIAGLLDALNVVESIKQEFSAFYQLRDKTSHIPYLAAWQALSSAEQRKFDVERLRYEFTFNDFVMDAALRIRGREF